MANWLVKSDPESYSWDDMLKDKKTAWDGVRNYQARNNLKKMKEGDMVLFYHSVQGTEVVGITKVSKEYFQDPTTNDDRWVAVELEQVNSLGVPVTLAKIKESEDLQDIALIKQSRLSVMPLTESEYNKILELSRDYNE
jgi:predicted RNA-binding protein with PUA-like domain